MTAHSWFEGYENISYGAKVNGEIRSGNGVRILNNGSVYIANWEEFSWNDKASRIVFDGTG
jgi:hypothetical protein